MKLLLSGALALGLATTSFAATFNVGNTNPSAATANGVVDSAGNLLINTTGSAAFGVFTGTDFTSAQSILTAFTPFGNNEGVFTEPVGLFAINGGFEVSGSSENDAIFTPTTNIDVIVGNATTLAASTEFAIIRLDQQYGVIVTAPGNAPANLDATVAIPTSSMIFGSNTGPDRTVSSFGGTSLPTFQTAAPVPEPATSLLLGGSLLALGFRRRRA